MIISANIKEGDKITEILDKYSRYAGLVTQIPDDKIPQVMEEIKKTLEKGCS